jgi:pimeloyl-ACP methyl ester carboxylesterase
MTCVPHVKSRVVRRFDRGVGLSTAIIDGIKTRYEVVGSGPPLLMYSPAGFDATLEKWTTQGIYAKIKVLDYLSKKFTCIIFDRRECGQSGGRVETVTWRHYVAQGKGLLDHLNIKRAHLMGGCMGCCPVLAFGVAYPGVALSLVLYWPVGGAKYRINSRQRFSEHLAFAEQQGLEQVVSLVKTEGKTFSTDPRVGPWAAVIKSDASFAESYARQEVDKYCVIVANMSRGLFDRDTAPGAEPEDLFRLEVPALIIPGRDPSHATSAARYLEECLPNAEYWDAPVEHQTEETANARLLNFLDKNT